MATTQHCNSLGCLSEESLPPELPPAIWVLVVGHLTLPSACRAACVSRTLHQAVSDVVSQVQVVQLHPLLPRPPVAQGSPHHDQQQQHQQRQASNDHGDLEQGVPLLRDCSRHPLFSLLPSSTKVLPSSSPQLHQAPAASAHPHPLVIRIPGHKGPAVLSYLACRGTGVMSLDLKGAARWVSDDWLHALAGTWAGAYCPHTGTTSTSASADALGSACTITSTNAGDSSSSGGGPHNSCASVQADSTQGQLQEEGQEEVTPNRSWPALQAQQHMPMSDSILGSATARTSLSAARGLQGLSLQEAVKTAPGHQGSAQQQQAGVVDGDSSQAEPLQSCISLVQREGCILKGWRGPTLASLELEGSGQLTEQGLQALCREPAIQASLRRLNITCCGEGVGSCESLTLLTGLTSLSCAWCMGVADAAILGLGQSLQHLDIKGCELLSNAIFAGLPHLVTINLAYTRITDAGLQVLAEKCPRLQQVELGESSLANIYATGAYSAAGLQRLMQARPDVRIKLAAV